MVTACDTDGNLFSWEFEVDPITREVLYSKSPKVIKDIEDTLLDYSTWVFHNSTFDIRALQLISERLYDAAYYLPYRVQDTLIMAHIIDSADRHGLKYLGELHLDIPADDEHDLKTAVAESRKVAKKIGLSSASIDTESLPNHRGEYGFCDYWLPKAVAVHEGYPSDHPWHTVCETYALRDVERTILLYQKFKHYLDTYKLKETIHVHPKSYINLNANYHNFYETLNDVYQEHREIFRPVLSIQQNGIRFFYNKAKKTINQLNEQLLPFQETIADMVGEDFNYRSTKQLREVLYDQFQFPILYRTAKGEPSTDAGTLEELANDYRIEGVELIDNILEIRKRETTIRYIENYISYAKEYYVTYENGKTHTLHYLHPSLNPTGTSTTRFSSSNPNGQNISKGEEVSDGSGTKKKVFNLRELFGPPPGHVWYTIDYKSLQLIIFAYESGDEGLINTFLSGGDPHHYVACGLFDTDSPTELERRIAKNVNYGLIFGAGKAKIDATAGREGTYQLYNDQFPGVNRYMQEVIKNARRDGYVSTAWGYPLEVPLEQAYKGVNYIIQGDEGEIVKRAMIYCNQYLENTHTGICRLIMQIHDELIFECPVDYPFPLANIKRLMMKPAEDIGWVTPVDAAIVRKHWGDKESV
jgi:DNA polymerase I-like protein with 3'-5' exonuclease and polymerase domains